MQPKLPFQKYLFFLFIGILLTTSLNACTTSPWWVKFVKIDKKLEDILVISDVIRTHTKETNNLLRIDVIVLNTSYKTITAAYKFYWLDENGLEIQGLASELTPFQVETKSRTQLSKLAPSPQVKQFRLQIFHPKTLLKS